MLDKRDQDKVYGCLKVWGSIVIKPSQGEQGKGITADIDTREEAAEAIIQARSFSSDVIIEEYVRGHDVRMIVIDHRFVAAIERIPAFIIGDGKLAVGELIEMKNRELYQKSQGESQIPTHSETIRVINKEGYHWDSVLEKNKRLQVCKTANYHTGGTILDATPLISPFFRGIAEQASKILDIPVVGLDFIIPDYRNNQYVIIEANERPGLANHEPQPTAERFIDFLFPSTKNE